MMESNQVYTFPCGCKMRVLGTTPNKGELPSLDWDIEATPVDCPGTWELLSTGQTKGIFQVESQLGKTWSKKIGPHNLEDMSAIGALLRPGCLRAFTDGKSMTQHYADRKNNLEEVKSFHPVVDAVLAPTYGVLTYQEQAMKLAEKVANFSLEEADTLRKAIGKKLPEEMAKVKTLFIQKAKEAGILNEQQIEEVWGWIEKSQRYSFNKCLSPKTLVETKEKLMTIEDIEVGEEIKTPYGWSKVINKYNNGIKELYSITLESGKEIECTLEHEFLCEDGVKRPIYQILSENLKILCEND